MKYPLFSEKSNTNKWSSIKDILEEKIFKINEKQSFVKDKTKVQDRRTDKQLERHISEKESVQHLALDDLKIFSLYFA